MARIFPGATAIVFALVVLLPIAYLVGVSFLDDRGALTTEHYRIYSSGALWHLLWRSLLLAGGAAVLSLLVGVPAGILLARTNLWLKPIWATLVIVPLLVPPYMMTICWFYLLVPEGWINQSLLPFLGLGAINFHAVDGFPGTIFSFALSYFPIPALLTWIGVRTPDRVYEEAGRLSRPPWSAFFRLTVPAAAPFILTGGIFVFFFALINYAVPYQFSIGGIFVSEIHSQFQAHHNNAQAAALTAPFLLGSAALLWAERRALRRQRSAVRGESTAPPPRLGLGRAQPLALLFMLWLTGLAAVGPVAVLVWMAWPFDQMLPAIDACRPELISTLWISALAAAVTLVLAAGVAVGARRPGRLGRALDLGSILPLAFPPMALGIGLIVLWNRSTVFGAGSGWVGSVSDVIYGSFLIMVFLLLGRSFPFAMRPVFYGLGTLDKRLQEAAWLAGAGPTRTFFRITLPLAWRSFALAWFLAFLFSVGEYDGIHLVQQPGYAMLAPRLIGSFHNFRHDLVSNNALVLMAVVILPILIYLLIPPSRARKERS